MAIIREWHGLPYFNGETKRETALISGFGILIWLFFLTFLINFDLIWILGSSWIQIIPLALIPLAFFWGTLFGLLFSWTSLGLLSWLGFIRIIDGRGD